MAEWIFMHADQASEHDGRSTRVLGRTGIPVGEVTVGTSGLGGSGDTADDERWLRTAIAALRGPFADVDTSNLYADGRSETWLGRARAELGDAGDATGDSTADSAARIITKVDRDPQTGRFDRDRVLRSYEESLERLGLDRVSVLHLHDPYTVTVAEAFAPGGAVEALVELRESGAVDAIGIAAGPIDLMTEYVTSDAFDVLLSHNRYTLVDRSAEPLFIAARERGMGVFNAAPFGAGLLARGTGTSYGYRPVSDGLLDWVRAADGLCREHGVTLAAAALGFSLRSPLVDSTVVGVSSAERIAQLDDLRRVAVPDELWARIDGLGSAPSPLHD